MSTMISPDLLLDPKLKYWVLLPISFVMVVVGLLRSNITLLLTPAPKLTPYKSSRESYVSHLKLDCSSFFCTIGQILTKFSVQSILE